MSTVPRNVTMLASVVISGSHDNGYRRAAVSVVPLLLCWYTLTRVPCSTQLTHMLWFVIVWLSTGIKCRYRYPGPFADDEYPLK